MHFDLAGLVFIALGTTTILFRRAYTQHYLRVLERTWGLDIHSARESRIELLCVILGIVVTALGIGFFVTP